MEVGKQLKFFIKSTVPVRVYIIFGGSSIPASMSIYGGNLIVDDSLRKWYGIYSEVIIL